MGCFLASEEPPGSLKIGRMLQVHPFPEFVSQKLYMKRQPSGRSGGTSSLCSPEAQSKTPNIHSSFDPKWVRLLLDHPGALPTIHIYGSLKRAFAWNFYRTARLFLNRVLLDLNDTIALPPSSDNSMAVGTDSMDCLDAEYQITRPTKDISASILCHFTVQILSKSNSSSPDNVCGMRVMSFSGL
jgi:hypothetical protein